MNRGDLALNLARSLVLGHWTEVAIRQTLARRLPRPLHHLIDLMCRQLVTERLLAYAPEPRTLARHLQQTEAFETIHLYCIDHDVWPGPDLSPPLMAPTAAFVNLDLPQLADLDALAARLFLPAERLQYLADVSGRHAAHTDPRVNHFHYVLKSKPSGGIRLIEAPKPQLKAAQSRILDGILDRIPVHRDCFGFVSGRNCIGGASRHAGEQAVACFDLKDFFPSIPSARVFGLFRCLGFPHRVAQILTGLCTATTPPRIVSELAAADRHKFRRAHLPQGAPTSPALANHAAFGLDRRLSGLARSLNLNYSRYADDLSFSGDKGCIAALLRAMPEIVTVEGLQLNPAKTRIMPNTARQSVTGIVVNQHLNIGRDEFDRLKAVIYACAKPGDTRLDDPAFLHSLLGKISWVESVNPQRGAKLRKLLSSAVEGRTGTE